MKELNNNIQESYCSFEVSKLLKEKGFSVGSNHSYILYLITQKSDNPSFRMKKGELELDSSFIMNNGPGDFSNDAYCSYERPTHSVAIEWIRVNFGIHLYVACKEKDNGEVLYVACGRTTPFTKDEKGIIIDCIPYNPKNSPQEATESALLYTLQNLIP